MPSHGNPLIELSTAMADAVEKANTYTVMVDARRRFPASGVAYSEDLILTANHVVEHDEDIHVILPDGIELTANVVGRDPGSDLALLRLERSAATPAAILETPGKVGQVALALGRPTSEGIQASLGILSAFGGPARTLTGGLLESHIRTDAIPYPGFSGGPLVDAEGRLIGVNTSGLGRGNSLAIPAALAWRIAGNLAEHGSIKRGFLGVRSQHVEVSPDAQGALGRRQETGLLIINVEEDSPAQEAGLMVGDILVGIAGHPVVDHDELLAHLTGALVGKSTQIEVLRGGKLVSTKVTVAERQEQRQRRRHRRMTWWGHHHYPRKHKGGRKR